MDWRFGILVGLFSFIPTWAVGGFFVYALFWLRRRIPFWAQTLLFGIIATVFGAPGLLPVVGGGHGAGVVIVPAWLTVALLGTEIQWVAPETAAYPMFVVFLISTILYWYRYRAKPQPSA
jgi:hypothetical protein